MRSSALTLPLDIDHTQTTHSRTHTPHTSTRTHTHTIAGPKEQCTQLLGEMSKSMAGFKRAHNLPRATPEPPSSLAPTDQHSRAWTGVVDLAVCGAFQCDCDSLHSCSTRVSAHSCSDMSPRRTEPLLQQHSATSCRDSISSTAPQTWPPTHKVTQVDKLGGTCRPGRQISKSVLATNNHANN